jgi:hypothetical protein
MPCSTHTGFEAGACHAARMPILKQQYVHTAAMLDAAADAAAKDGSY